MRGAQGHLGCLLFAKSKMQNRKWTWLPGKLKNQLFFNSCSWLRSTFRSPQKHHITGTNLKGRNKETTGVKLWGRGAGGMLGARDSHQLSLHTDRIPDWRQRLHNSPAPKLGQLLPYELWGLTPFPGQWEGELGILNGSSYKRPQPASLTPGHCNHSRRCLAASLTTGL